MIDAPHQDTQDGIAGSEDLHLLLHEVFLLRLPFGRQRAQGVGSGAGRRHGAVPPVCSQLSLRVSDVSGVPSCLASCLCKVARSPPYCESLQLRPAFTPPAPDTSEIRASGAGPSFLCVIRSIYTYDNNLIFSI